MTVTAAPGGAGLDPAGSSPTGPDEARRRGGLIVAKRVIEKIAGQAASEVAAASGRSGGLLGIGSDADPKARPKVDAELAGEAVNLDVAVGVAYPGSIRRAVQQIRDHVTERVETLTGVDVGRVDIDVVFLTTSDPNPRKRLLR